MVATTEVTMEAMAAMATTARGLLRLSPVTAMAAMEATTEVTMEAMAAMATTARGLLRLSPVTAMAAMDATTEVTMEATAITVEKRHHHLNLQTYKSLCICDQLRVLNYARNKKSNVVLEVKFILEL